MLLFMPIARHYSLAFFRKGDVEREGMRVRVFVILFGGFKVTFHHVCLGHGINDGLVQNAKFFAAIRHKKSLSPDW
jgi:hypothetical protein